MRVYTTNDCSGAPSASGSAAAFGGAGLGVTVADDSTTTFKATATDGAGNTSSCSAGYTYVEDSTLPASTVAFPSAGGEYRAATWADFSGTASDVGSGLARVELSIERLADGQFWNGSAFSGSSEDWRTASGAASWSYAFPVAELRLRRAVPRARAGGRRRREHRSAVQPHVHDRPRRAEHDHRRRPGRSVERREPFLHLLVGARRDVRVQPRRRRGGLVHEPEELLEPGGGVPHVLGHRNRRGRKRRRDPRDADVDARHDEPEHDVLVPGRRRLVQPGGLERLRRQRNGHGRRRAAAGRALDPQRRERRLLGRERLRERDGGLARGERHHVVDARVPGDELRRRRRLRGARACGRQRDEHERRAAPVVQRRHRASGDDRRLRPFRQHGERRRDVHLLCRPGRLDVRVPTRRRLVGGLREPEVVHRSRRGQPHVRRPCDRRRRQHRSDGGLANVVRRHDAADGHARQPAELDPADRDAHGYRERQRLRRRLGAVRPLAGRRRDVDRRSEPTRPRPTRTTSTRRRSRTASTTCAQSPPTAPATSSPRASSRTSTSTTRRRTPSSTIQGPQSPARSR